MLLTLPALAPDIPSVIEFGSHNERHLRLALAMCRSGMLPDSVLARQRRSRFDSSALIKLIETGWLREIGPLFDFKAIPVQATLLIPNGEGMSSEEFIGDSGEPQCAVVFNAGQPNWFVVGSLMESLEAQHKGLGRKVLNVIDSALCWWCMPFTPSGAFEMAQMLYWQGESDEKGVLAEYEANGDDASDVWKRGEIFDCAPDWAYESNGKFPKLLSDRSFSRIAKRMAKTPFGPLLGLLDRLNVLTDTNRRPLLPDPPKEFQCTEPMAVLYWRENDNLGRVFDDYWQYESQGEQAPYLGSIAFSLREEDLSNALMRVRHTSNVLRALDDVLVALDALNKSMRE